MIEERYKKLLYFVLTFLLLINIQPAVYAFDCSNYRDQLENPDDDESILYLLCPLQTGINIGLYFVGAVLIILVLYGGIKAILATGDPQQLEGARSVWTHAIFWAAIILGSVLIIRILLGLIGYRLGSTNPLDLTSNQGLVTELGNFFEILNRVDEDEPEQPDPYDHEDCNAPGAPGLPDFCLFCENDYDGDDFCTICPYNTLCAGF